MSSRDLVVAAASASAPSAPNFKNVSLLLNGDGTNGAQNNTFLDSSTNNFTITRNGNATQGTFSPYGNLWSNYFDGNGDYLTIQYNSALTMGNGDFTIECWYYPNAFANHHLLLMQDDGNSNNQNFQFIVNSSGVFEYTFWTASSRSSATSISGSTSVTLNTWNHLAVSYSASNTTTRLFLNGTQVGSSTSAPWNSSTYSGQTAIGNFTSGVNQTAAYAKVNGYISNIRMIKGTALYTSNFTPSITPLTAVSGTSLLTCQSNRFIDNSSNNFTLTVNGNTSVQRFSPFNPTAPYSAATIGGSGYFDGSGDYLAIANTTAFDLPADFTIEFWWNPSSLAGTQSLVGKWNITQYAWLVQATSTTLTLQTASTATGTLTTISNSWSPSTGQWYHIAFTRSGSSVKSFVNGSQIGTTQTSSRTCTSTATTGIGANPDGPQEYSNGYISNLRIVKGAAVYTSAFTPPTAPLTAITNTSLLLNFTNAGIPDAAMMNNLETVGNAQVSTSVKKYGTGSLYFDGSGDWLIAPDSPNYSFGTGPFTIEGWVYFNTSGFQTIIAKTYGWGPFAILASSTALTYYLSSNGSTWDIASGVSFGSITTSQWYHFALVRNGNIFTPYLNGIAGTSTTSSASLVSNTRPLTVGAIGNNAGNFESPLNGYIDDLRITKGLARYTANFTPPAQALPTQ